MHLRNFRNYRFVYFTVWFTIWTYWCCLLLKTMKINQSFHLWKKTLSMSTSEFASAFHVSLKKWCNFMVNFKHFGATICLIYPCICTTTLWNSFIVYKKWFKAAHGRTTGVQAAISAILREISLFCHFRVNFKHFEGTISYIYPWHGTCTLLNTYILHEKWFRVVYGHVTDVQ